MKKTIVAIAMGLSLGSAMYATAASMGPYGYDDRGAQINSAPTIYGTTSAIMNTLTPYTTGQILFVTDATQSMLCISSGTNTGAWVVIAATGAFVGGASGLNYPHCK